MPQALCVTRLGHFAFYFAISTFWMSHLGFSCVHKAVFLSDIVALKRVSEVVHGCVAEWERRGRLSERGRGFCLRRIPFISSYKLPQFVVSEGPLPVIA